MALILERIDAAVDHHSAEEASAVAKPPGYHRCHARMPSRPASRCLDHL